MILPSWLGPELSGVQSEWGGYFFNDNQFHQYIPCLAKKSVDSNPCMLACRYHILYKKSTILEHFAFLLMASLSNKRKFEPRIYFPNSLLLKYAPKADSLAARLWHDVMIGGQIHVILELED